MNNSNNVVISKEQYLKMTKLLKYLESLISKYDNNGFDEDDEWTIYECAHKAKDILKNLTIK